MTKPVPNGAMALAGGETKAPAPPEAASSEASSEESAPPHAETKITAPKKSAVLLPPRLKMVRPTVGGFIPLSTPSEKVHPNDKAVDHLRRSSTQLMADRIRATDHRANGRLPV